MPPLDFPSSPTNGQAYQGYVYSTSIGAWQAKPSAQSPFYTGDTPPGNPVVGDSWFNTNDGTMYVYYYDGNTFQWVEHRSQIARNQVGLVPVTPSSVVVGSGTASVDVNGLITFSGASTVSFNGCFTSSFRNYRFIISDMQSNNPNYPAITFRLRNAGSDISSEYWNWGIRAVSGSGITQRGSNTTSGMEIVGAIGWGGKYASLTADVTTPFLPTNTTMLSSSVGFDATSAMWQSQSCFKNDTSSYDGFSLIASVGNFSGTAKIYGYN